MLDGTEHPRQQGGAIAGADGDGQPRHRIHYSADCASLARPAPPPTSHRGSARRLAGTQARIELGLARSSIAPQARGGAAARVWPRCPRRRERPPFGCNNEPWAVSHRHWRGQASPCRATRPYLRRPEPGAAGRGHGRGRAAAGAGRCRHRQDPRADHAAGAYPADRPRPAARGAGGHLHQQGRARDGRARRGADRPQRRRACGSARSTPWACGCCARTPSWSACKPSFTILDSDDQERLAKQVIQAAELDERRWPPRGCWSASSSAGRTAATGRTRCRPRRSATSRSAAASRSTPPTSSASRR